MKARGATVIHQLCLIENGSMLTTVPHKINDFLNEGEKKLLVHGV